MVLAVMAVVVLLLAVALGRPRRHEFPEAERWDRARQVTGSWDDRVDGPPAAAAWCRVLEVPPAAAFVPVPPSPGDDVPTAA